MSALRSQKILRASLGWPLTPNGRSSTRNISCRKRSTSSTNRWRREKIRDRWPDIHVANDHRSISNGISLAREQGSKSLDVRATNPEKRQMITAESYRQNVRINIPDKAAMTEYQRALEAIERERYAERHLGRSNEKNHDQGVAIGEQGAALPSGAEDPFMPPKRPEVCSRCGHSVERHAPIDGDRISLGRRCTLLKDGEPPLKGLKLRDAQRCGCKINVIAVNAKTS